MPERATDRERRSTSVRSRPRKTGVRGRVSGIRCQVSGGRLAQEIPELAAFAGHPLAMEALGPMAPALAGAQLGRDFGNESLEPLHESVQRRPPKVGKSGP